MPYCRNMNVQHRQKISFSEAILCFRRNQPQVYRIMVAGALDPDWSDRLGGLRIESRSEATTDHPITVLQGLVPDQGMLSGVLNTLYDLRLPLLSVELIEDNTIAQGENS